MTNKLAGNEKHILVLDDDDLFLDMAQVFLKTYGCRVSPFASVGAAIDFVKKESGRIDAVICDVNLRTGSSGLEFYEQLRTFRNFEKTLFAFITGEAIQSTRLQKLMEDKNIKVFLKPLTFSQVIRFVLGRDATQEPMATKSA